MDKRSLRKSIKAIIATLNTEYTAQSSINICSKLLKNDRYLNAQNVFVYLSTDKEVCTDLIIEDLVKRNRNIYIPLCIDNDMYAVKYPCELIKNKYGILEPSGLSDTIKVEDIDLAIVPCLSASKNGKRLGHGKGYYDRFLNDDFYTICLCFEKLLSEEIEMDEYDRYMNEVITEGE